MSKLIQAELSPEAVKLILDLTSIALSAHQNNPSPVDIKLQLASIDIQLLMQTNEDAQRIICSNNIPT